MIKFDESVRNEKLVLFEKRFLYEELKQREKERLHLDKYNKRIANYLEDLYKKYLIPEKLKSLYPECSRVCNKIYGLTIDFSSIGVDKVYPKDIEFTENKGLIDIKGCKILGSFIDVRDLILPDDGSFNEYNRSEFIDLLKPHLENEEITILRNLCYEYLERLSIVENYLREYVDNFGWWNPYPFKKTFSTYYSLYKLNPDWYEIVYKEFIENRENNMNLEKIEEKQEMVSILKNILII